MTWVRGPSPSAHLQRGMGAAVQMGPQDRRPQAGQVAFDIRCPCSGRLSFPFLLHFSCTQGEEAGRVFLKRSMLPNLFRLCSLSWHERCGKRLNNRYKLPTNSRANLPPVSKEKRSPLVRPVKSFLTDSTGMKVAPMDPLICVQREAFPLGRDHTPSRSLRVSYWPQRTRWR